ncbi:MAG: 3-methyl-2-oxobutanoate hydroxymethyltransferase [Candidatus Dormibacteraeota bacterium]|nr:3-methyl-2-oxobutanoate hydroxymethyltransferase [Candidatus Dormibacteraeota bacterium]
MSVTIKDLQAYKRDGKRFAMLTAYDFTTALIIDEAGIPVILVGDSLANTMLGYDTTLPVTMEEMLHHTRAVRRGVQNALLVGDMPFMSYHASVEDAIGNAGRFLKEGGANAIKLEGGGRIIEITERLTAMGIPVMAHLGLTPQFVNQMGGFKVQGRSDEAAEQIQRDAVALQAAGAFALVLEGIPAPLGKLVTGQLDIPTIGIGAGPDCDAQVLVIQDMLGLSGEKVPKFVKRFADMRGVMTGAVQQFIAEVEGGSFPGPEHSYGVAAPKPDAASEPVGEGAIYGGGKA